MALVFPTTDYISRMTLGLRSPDPSLANFVSGFTQVRYRAPAQWVGAITIPAMDHKTGELLEEVEVFFERMASESEFCYIPLLNVPTIVESAVLPRVVAYNSSDEGLVIHFDAPLNASVGMVVDIGDRIYRVADVPTTTSAVVAPAHVPGVGDYVRPATTMAVQPETGVFEGLGVRNALFHFERQDNPPFSTENRTLQFKSYIGPGVLPRPRQYFFLSSGQTPIRQARTVSVGRIGITEGLLTLTAAEGAIVGFSSSTYEYSVSVGSSVVQETFTLTAPPGVEIYIQGRTEPQVRPGDDVSANTSGAVVFSDLRDGLNELRIMARGEYDVWYRINLTKAPTTGTLDTDSSLTSLGIGGHADIETTPAFSATRLAYNVVVPSQFQTYTVAPVATSTLATIEVDGETIVPGTGRAVVVLPTTGSQTTRIVCTAQNGTSTIYTLTGSRQAVATLTSLDFLYSSRESATTRESASAADLEDLRYDLQKTLNTATLQIRPQGPSGTTLAVESTSGVELAADAPVGRYTSIPNVRQGADIYFMTTKRAARGSQTFNVVVIRDFVPTSTATLTGLTVSNPPGQSGNIVQPTFHALSRNYPITIDSQAYIRITATADTGRTITIGGVEGNERDVFAGTGHSGSILVVVSHGGDSRIYNVSIARSYGPVIGPVPGPPLSPTPG